jgi:uncharacterized membrane protein
VFVALLISAEAPREGIALGWVAMSLSLLLAGLRFRIRDLTLQGIQLAGLSFGAALVYDIEPPRMLICISMVAALYFAQWITRRSQESRASGFISAASTILLSTVLGSKVSGEILTVAWGLQGLALLGSGFPLGERILRLQGLVLLMVCILKLFLYDLRNLETAYRILSFIALGLILLLVSWIYSRYRDGLRRLL